MKKFILMLTCVLALVACEEGKDLLDEKNSAEENENVEENENFDFKLSDLYGTWKVTYYKEFDDEEYYFWDRGPKSDTWTFCKNNEFSAIMYDGGGLEYKYESKGTYEIKGDMIILTYTSGIEYYYDEIESTYEDEWEVETITIFSLSATQLEFFYVIEPEKGKDYSYSRKWYKCKKIE